MTVLLILLIVLPWSIWRQMRARPITAEGLVKLPLIFAGVAAVIALTSHAPEITPTVWASRGELGATA